MNVENQFERFADVVMDLPDGFADRHPLPGELLMSADSRHEVYYAPFDHVTRTARMVLVGITPGRSQALEAIGMARSALRAGKTHDWALSQAKTAASFSGPMRSNLVALLDHVGVAERLGIQTTAQLWESERHLVHFTSALRYPVFEDGRNYSGGGLDRSPLLLGELDRWFARECAALPGALFVPLGKAALSACERLANCNLLRRNQILYGLPHPSGANAERIAYFLGRKSKSLLSAKTRPQLIDAGREVALRCVEGWA